MVSPELWECPRIVSGGEGFPQESFWGKWGEECFSQASSPGSRNPFPLTAKGSSAIKSEDLLLWQEHRWDGLSGSFPATGQAALWILSLVPPESRPWEVAWSTGDCLGFLQPETGKFKKDAGWL